MFPVDMPFIIYPLMSTTEVKGQGEAIEIEKSIVIDASPEVVFKAITDPKKLTSWFPDQVILEPKIGGEVQFLQKLYQALSANFIPNKKIFSTWEDSYEPVVTWELEKIENNKTSIKLLHTGFKADEKVNTMKVGLISWKVL